MSLILLMDDLLSIGIFMYGGRQAAAVARGVGGQGPVQRRGRRAVPRRLAAHAAVAVVARGAERQAAVARQSHIPLA